MSPSKTLLLTAAAAAAGFALAWLTIARTSSDA